MSFLTKPTCDPVFKKFLSRLMREVYRAGEPTDANDIYYNAKIKLSRPAMVEIQSFLDGEDNWRNGALDHALNGILVELKPPNFFTSFEYMIGPILKIGCLFLTGLLIAHIQQWPRVSWFKHFTTIFAISFFVSIPWNWFYLYKEAYAKHQSNIMKMEKLHHRCTGQGEIGWFGSLVEWYRTSFTLQGDPCEEYIKVIIIDPLVEVPPIKAVVYTLTTFITEPLRAFGEGISVFFQALLKDLPVILWIPVLIIVTLCSLAALFGAMPAIFHHHVRRFLPWMGGVLPVNAQAPIQLQIDNASSGQNVIHQRQPNRTRREPNIQIIRSADLSQSEEVADAEGWQENADEGNNISIESEFEDQLEIQEEVRSAVTTTDQPEGRESRLDYLQAKKKQMKTEKKVSQDESCNDGAAPTPQAYRRKVLSTTEIPRD